MPGAESSATAPDSAGTELATAIHGDAPAPRLTASSARCPRTKPSVGEVDVVGAGLAGRPGTGSPALDGLAGCWPAFWGHLGGSAPAPGPHATTNAAQERSMQGPDPRPDLRLTSPHLSDAPRSRRHGDHGCTASPLPAARGARRRARWSRSTSCARIVASGYRVGSAPRRARGPARSSLHPLLHVVAPILGVAQEGPPQRTHCQTSQRLYGKNGPARWAPRRPAVRAGGVVLLQRRIFHAGRRSVPTLRSRFASSVAGIASQPRRAVAAHAGHGARRCGRRQAPSVGSGSRVAKVCGHARILCRNGVRWPP